MAIAVVQCRAALGVRAPLVSIEVHLSKGLPSLSIVGLPATVVRESKDRVRSAIINSGFEFPIKRITINLAPADLPKEGGRFDLPIAIGILAASKQIHTETLKHYEFTGELALSGALRSVANALPIAMAAQSDKKALICPVDNASEVAFISDFTCYPASHLTQVVAHLNHVERLHLQQQQDINISIQYQHDLSDIKGLQQARRVLEIAAAGGHSLLFSGPPGTGKTLLASRLPTILPPMTELQALETAAIYSVSSQLVGQSHWLQRPFRAPHHSASAIALVGGGNPPRPGEISLANHGVLFLDELPEFNRHVLESLREPLESGTVMVSRAGHQAVFPAQCQLVAAMNPCPCGYFGASVGHCRCTREQVQRYQSRLSGPLLDRIDLFLSVQPLSAIDLMAESSEVVETSTIVRARVTAARKVQLQRLNTINAHMSHEQCHAYCALDAEGKAIFKHAITQFELSPRAYYRILKVARTIADLAQESVIRCEHLHEALAYRVRNHAVGWVA